MHRTDNLRQHSSYRRRQIQAGLDPSRLNAQNMYFRALRLVKELQHSPQSESVQGMPLSGFGKVRIAAVAEGPRSLASIHRVDHEYLDTLIEKSKRAEEVRLDGHNRRLGRRINLQEAGGMDPHAVVGQQTITDPKDQIGWWRVHPSQIRR